MNIRALTEKMLFEYYMISNVREEEIFSPFPFYIDKESFQELTHSAEILHQLMYKITKEIQGAHQNFKGYFDDFPFKDDILKLKRPLVPFFWNRLDGFLRENGGIFFSEFNLDKPCAQREIAASGALPAYQNPNLSFKKAFKESFDEIIEEYAKPLEKYIIGILVDPCHYEELHLAHLYMDLLRDEKYEFIIAGARNFKVLENQVYAFDRPVDVILRQFPVEFLHEVKDFDRILSLFDQGELLLLNDPRAIVGQAKSIFAYLWELSERNQLEAEEVKVIRKTLPFTQMFTSDMEPELLRHKNNYVIKSVFGRYSLEVYIGAMMTEEEWQDILSYVKGSPKLHIIQKFCPIHKDSVLKLQNDGFEPVNAYGNLGVYLAKDAFAGICVRWSEDYLTSDGTTWITPIGIKQSPYRILPCTLSNRSETWENINEKLRFEYMYTGGYTRDMEAFSLDALLLPKNFVKEIEDATNTLCMLLEKAQKVVLANIDLLAPLLGISKRLTSLLPYLQTKEFGFVGRFDFAVDEKGQLKVLEFNAETPAGIIDALAASKLVKEKLRIPYENPNEGMENHIYEVFQCIIGDFEKQKEIKNIAFLSSTYNEDWYNTYTLYKAMKDFPCHLEIGNIYDLKVKDKQIILYGKPIDAVYRHYPLDWFESESEELQKVLDAFAAGTYSINPPHTIITQSKGIFALLYELAEQGFYTQEEKDFIMKYVPYTTLAPEKLAGKDFCIKPMLGREGESVRFSFNNNSALEDNCIYQERIEIPTIDWNVYTTSKTQRLPLYPILGAFTAGSGFTGIYSRMGSMISDRWVVYAPTYTFEE